MYKPYPVFITHHQYSRDIETWLRYVGIEDGAWAQTDQWEQAPDDTRIWRLSLNALAGFLRWAEGYYEEETLRRLRTEITLRQIEGAQ